VTLLQPQQRLQQPPGPFNAAASRLRHRAQQFLALQMQLLQGLLASLMLLLLAGLNAAAATSPAATAAAAARRRLRAL
jgi:hypothetical protein